ncbi:MAG: RNA methyltransferase [Bacteroidales bacterium]|nr:RNA methyltransferase [Bacteroidales bacterium]
MNKELINYLEQFSAEQRIMQFNRVLENRTRYITVALEDIYLSQNASAVLRTSECFGLQDVHIIENKYEYNINPDVVMGSSKWLNLIKYNNSEDNTLEAIKNIKNRGYRVVATTPHEGDVSLEQFDIEKGKVALFFGTEVTGLSDLMLENADEFLKIPMYGFTESFNISVSASIILQHLSYKLRSSAVKWQLSDTEKEELKLEWLKKSVKSSSMLIDKFLSKKKNN